MTRRLFTVAPVLSLLLCAAGGLLWLRSLQRLDNMGVNWRSVNREGKTTPHRMWICASRGELLIGFQIGTIVGDGGPSLYHFSDRPILLTSVFGAYEEAWFGRNFTVWKGAGFGYEHVANYSERIIGLLVPQWALVVLFAALPLFSWRTAVRFFRRDTSGSAALCLVCGYDLRASAERCPECGFAPSKLGRGG